MESNLNNNKLIKGVINNLNYYILSNKRPKDSIELRLLVHVGSLMEENNEQGIAHFIEHLGFKGTKSYIGYELVKALQSLGITYGADLNASTHLLDTTYRLNVSLDENLTQVKIGLNILKEWAFYMNISESDVQEEKHVISSEYLSKQGLGQRLLSRYWSKLFNNNDNNDNNNELPRLANRMPIGIPEVFMNTDSIKIREFYEKWYKPENMAVLVVGDIDGKEDQIESIIQDYFSKIPVENTIHNTMTPNNKNQILSNDLFGNIQSLKNQYLHLPTHHKKDVIICMQDRELTIPQISFEFFYQSHNSNTIEFIRDNIFHRLMTSIVDRRCAELVQKGKVPNDSIEALNSSPMPLQSLGMSVRELVRGLSCVGVTATLRLTSNAIVEENYEAKNNDDNDNNNNNNNNSSFHQAFETSIRLLLLEFRRLRTHGIYENELQDAKKKWAFLFSDQKDYQTTTSSSLISDLTTHIFSGGNTVFSTPTEEASLCLEVMNNITVDEMNQFLSKVLDMDLIEEKSNYYNHYYTTSSIPLTSSTSITINENQIIEKNPSFRLLSAQIPGKSTTSEDELEDILQSILNRSREYVNSLSSIDIWPISDVITEDTIISAAKTVVESLKTLSSKILDSSTVSQENYYSEEIKQFDSIPNQQLFQFDKPYCLCCKQRFCMFIDQKLDQSQQEQQKQQEQQEQQEKEKLSINKINDQEKHINNTKISSKPIKIVKLENIGAIEFTLSNGIKICVKDMEKQSDSPGRVSLQAFALGGCTELTEEQDAVFSMLDSMCGHSTLYIGPLNQGKYLPQIGMYLDDGDCSELYKNQSNSDIYQIINGKQVNHIQSVTKTRVNIQRHLNFRGLGGSCPSEKFELLLALLTLKLTTQQIDQFAYNESIQQQRSSLNFRENSPEHVFMERARILSCGDIPYSRPLTIEILNHATIEIARNLYSKAFLNDPTEFTFTFVGDLPSIEQVSNLLEYYLGSLIPIPSKTKFEIGNWRQEKTLLSSLPFTQVGNNFVINERIKETIPLRQADKVSCLYVFRANLRNYELENEWNEEEQDLLKVISLDIACRSIQAALLDSLRIDMGKVYSVTSDFSRGSLSSIALISIGLHCHPNDLSQISNEIERCINEYRQNGPSEEIIKGIVESLLLKQKNALKCPSHWLFWILDTYKSYKIYEWKSLKLTSKNNNNNNNNNNFIESSEWVKYFANLRSVDKIDLITRSMSNERLIEIYQQFFDLSKSVQVVLGPLENSLES